MHKKVILAVIDGLNYQVAHDRMGYMNGLVETGRSLRKKVRCALPGIANHGKLSAAPDLCQRGVCPDEALR